VEPQARPTAEERQAFLDNISEDDLAKIQQVTGASDNQVLVDDEWLAIAEFGKHFGYPAIEAVLNDKITTDKMMTLIAAARKLDHLTLYNNARASFIGSGSAGSKKPSETFIRLTQAILKHIKADV
jgi:hypothetical protein